MLAFQVVTKLGLSLVLPPLGRVLAGLYSKDLSLAIGGLLFSGGITQANRKFYLGGCHSSEPGYSTDSTIPTRVPATGPNHSYFSTAQLLWQGQQPPSISPLQGGMKRRRMKKRQHLTHFVQGGWWPGFLMSKGSP